MDQSKISDLEKIIEIAVELFEPEKIILFGSQARGDFRPDSDIDLLIIDAKKDSRIGQLKLEFLKRGLKMPQCDAIKTSSEEIEKFKSSENHLLSRALKEGIVLHSCKDI